MNHTQSHERFLEEDPTFERRWQALSLNNQALFERVAQADNGEIFREGCVMGTHSRLGGGAITMTSHDPLQIDDQVDRILDWYQGRQPHHDAICWYLTPTPPGDLDACMFARGFSPNWQPHWMWCELRHLRRKNIRPSSFDIQIVEDTSGWQVDDLPNYNPDEAPILAALARIQPRQIWQLAAFQAHQMVGRCLLNVTTGEFGVAGLFSMGVVPSARKQGIGTALAQAACELAQQMGCHHVYLNATPMGEPVYRRVGFQSMGYGHTWFLRAQTLAAPPPTRDQVIFLEAIGRGDITTLDGIGKRLENSVLHEPSRNGLTPLDIAVRCQQTASAAWLVEHGVRLDLLSAWDLGWKERIPAILAEHPELVNLQRGEWHATPLHIAIERGDIEFAKLLLTVPNDLTIKDGAFQSTALGWAHFFDRPEIIALLKHHRTNKDMLE